MTGSTCPACGEPANGNFCSQCGSSLSKPAECLACGNQVPLGGRFCNMCGTPVGQVAANDDGSGTRPSPAGSVPSVARGAAGAKSGLAPSAADAVQVDEATSVGASPSTLAAAGISLVALLAVLFILLPRLSEPDVQPATTGPFASGVSPNGGAAAGDPSAIDLGSMTPEEAATRLFNRVMTAVSQGDSVSARQFAPMAIGAYDMLTSQDLDTRYHVALLHLVNLDLPGARATAESMLAEAPDHLFGLYTAAQAEQGMGNTDTARTFYQRFLNAYDAEIALHRAEYLEHAVILPEMLESARQFLGTVE